MEEESTLCVSSIQMRVDPYIQRVDEYYV